MEYKMKIIIPQDTELNYSLSLSTSVSLNGNGVSLSSPENTYYPLKNNDVVSIVTSYSILDSNGNTFDPTTDKTHTYSVSGKIISTAVDSVPNGLTGSYSSGKYTLSGTVFDIEYSHYSIVIRFTLSVFDSNNNLIGTNYTDSNVTFWTGTGETISFYWDSDWLNSLPQITLSDNSKVYVISQVGKGAYINNSVLLDTNQDLSSQITYELLQSSETLPQTFTFNSDTINASSHQSDNVPSDISIKQNGSFGGSVAPDTASGYYFFSISASINLNGTIYYATPNSNLDTRGAKFCIIVGDYYEYNYANQLTWKTSSGSLGEIYEGYPSYFTVEADSNSGNVIYALAPYSTLPDGMYIDTNGYVSGVVPYTSVPETIEFSIRANVGNIYSDRSFSFKILPLYGSTDFFNFKFPIYQEQVKKIKKLQSLITNNIFRSSDPYYGINSDYNPYFISGLLGTDDIVGYWDTTLTSSDSLYGVGQNRSVITLSNEDHFAWCLLDKLRNYHKPYRIVIDDIEYEKMYSVDNNYICDVVYLHLKDFHTPDSSFQNQIEYIQKNNNDSIFSKISYDSSIIATSIFASMMPNLEEIVFDNGPLSDRKDTFSRVITPSISNCRNDLLLTTNRINSPTNMIRPNAKPGIGLLGGEGMPAWMMNGKSPIGYVPSVVIAYVDSGYGQQIVDLLKSSDEWKHVIGTSWIIDRYVYENRFKSSTIFDDDTTTFDSDTTLFDLMYGYNKSYTTFDNNNTIFDSGSTLFDVVNGFNESYIFFPREIMNDL